MSETVKAAPAVLPNTTQYYESILKLAITIGHSLQMCAAETYRVEDTCTHILNAYGCNEVEVFAVANYLSISFVSKEGGDYYAQKRLKRRSDNLGKIDLLNRKSRAICAEIPDPDEALKDIRDIMDLPNYPFKAQVLITGMVGLGFTLLIGGSLAAGIYAFFIDIILRLCLEPLFRQQTNRIFVNILGGMLVTLMAWPCHYLGLGHEMNRIVSGSFMYLFPGVSLMNSVRDMIASDYLAGMTKLLETLLVAISIAIGSGLALAMLGRIPLL